MSRHAAVGRTDRFFMAINLGGKESYNKVRTIARGEGEKGVFTVPCGIGVFDSKFLSLFNDSIYSQIPCCHFVLLLIAVAGFYDRKR
jgi:hypothetical protein